jgi:RNA polymerase sigma-70 factor (ECF subfamily)
MDADTRLFLRTKEGDDQAFKKLYQKYYKIILNLIFRFIPNHQDAEDIAQEVFLRAYFGARTFSPQSKFSTWLYKITVNRCFSHHKKIKRDRKKYISESDLHSEEEASNSVNIENNPSALSSPNGHIIQKELHQVIQSALNKLPPDQKMAFILLEYSGLSYQEIARVSGGSVKAVERRIYHARQKLRKLLKPYIKSS